MGRGGGTFRSASPSATPFHCLPRTDSELRPERVVAFRKKFAQLAEAEEKAFLSGRQQVAENAEDGAKLA